MPHPFFFPPARFYIIQSCLPFSPAFSFCPLLLHILSVHSAFTAAGQTHVYISPASLSSHQCIVGPPLCWVAFFIVCVCCFAPLVGPPHHQHHQRFSFIPFSVALSPADSPFQSLHAYGKLTNSHRFHHQFNSLQRNIRNTFSLSKTITV